MTITHHLDDATLMSFAAGALPDALSAVASARVAMCAHCRAEMASLEHIGGALMAGLPPVAIDRAEPPPQLPTRAADLPRHPASLREGEIPRPIAHLVAGGLDAVTWRWLGPGVWDHPLPVAGAGKLRLLRVAPRRSVPEHGHGGMEITLVLRGSFHDVSGRYCRGDVAELDETIAHQPITDPGPDCICAVASETPEQFRSGLARQWQRLRRI